MQPEPPDGEVACQAGDVLDVGNAVPGSVGAPGSNPWGDPAPGNRDDWAPFELFLAGVVHWEPHVLRFLRTARLSFAPFTTDALRW